MKKINYIFIFVFYFTFSSLSADINYFQKGKNLFTEKKYDQAKFKFEQDLVFNPKNENSYLYLAKIFKLKNDDNQEESNLKTVILLNPKNEEAIYNLALLKIRKSNYSETKKLLDNFKKNCQNMCQKSDELRDKLSSITKK